jgi:hypothetical protein
LLPAGSKMFPKLLIVPIIPQRLGGFPLRCGQWR